MTNVLFIGKFFSPKLLDSIKSDKFTWFSTHNFELSMIKGLSLHHDVCLKVLTCPGVYSYPHNNKHLFTKSESFKINDVQAKSIGFCNLFIVNRIWKFLSSFLVAYRTIKSFEGDNVNILINIAASSSLRAISFLRRFSKKKIYVTIYVLDVPHMVNTMDKYNIVKSTLLKFIDNSTMRIAEKCDHMMVVAEPIYKLFNTRADFVVMEGLVDLETMDKGAYSFSIDKEIILYTGTLRKLFGVLNLVEAFEKMKARNVELWFCGAGDAEKEIETHAQKDERIKSFGLVSSQEALCMQRKATILVNPRTSEGEYTSYSFPSKNTEYLLAGKNVLFNALPGIPTEYFKYAYRPNDESVDALAEALDQIISLPFEERKERAEQGRRFILENKNAQLQMGKVLAMMKK